MSHISDKIICPKCNTQNLRKSIVGPHNSKYSNQTGKEYFCDKDHEYFGIEELVHEWNYDLGDFAPSFEDYLKLGNEISNKIEREFLKRAPSPVVQWANDTVSDLFEDTDPDSEFPWNSLKERDEAYQVVTEMLLGIPAWATEDYSVDTGALHA